MKMLSKNRKGSNLVEMVIVIVLIVIISSAVLGLYISIFGSVKNSNQRLHQFELSSRVTGNFAANLNHSSGEFLGINYIGHPRAIPAVFGSGILTAGGVALGNNYTYPSTLSGDQLFIKGTTDCKRYMYIARLKELWMAQSSTCVNLAPINGLARGPNQVVGGTTLITSGAAYDSVLDSVKPNGSGKTDYLDKASVGGIAYLRLAQGVTLSGTTPVFRYYNSDNNLMPGIQSAAAIAAQNIPASSTYYRNNHDQISSVNITFKASGDPDSSFTNVADRLVTQDFFLSQACQFVD